MSGKGVHRVTGNSKRGRQLTSRVYVTEQAPADAELRDWNQRVEDKKQAKAFAREKRK